MNLLNWLFQGVYTQLDRMEATMDQERLALDALKASLDTHFTTVSEACAKIIELINTPAADPDVDNSAEIAALAGQIQASTDEIKAALP